MLTVLCVSDSQVLLHCSTWYHATSYKMKIAKILNLLCQGQTMNSPTCIKKLQVLFYETCTLYMHPSFQTLTLLHAVSMMLLVLFCYIASVGDGGIAVFSSLALLLSK